MPTILRQDGFAVRLYFNDHEPPHVHVFKAEGQAKIALGDGEQLPWLLEVREMDNKTAKQALKLVLENRAYLSGKWKEFYD
ncbi:MAG: DUF4160 domain-containing protein [Geitlerinemataceae cyanobacterium]